MHGTCRWTAAELIPCWQGGTISTGKGYGPPWRGCWPAADLLTLTQATDDVLSAQKWMQLTFSF